MEKQWTALVNSLPELSSRGLRRLVDISHFARDETSSNDRLTAGEKKNLFIAIMDEFYTFDLVEIHVKNLSEN